MAEVIRMPKMSDTMEEGVIASWLKKEGDEVNSGDVLAEVETDKATMELESYQDGTLLHIGVKEQDSVAVDGVIAIIGEKGEDIKDLLAEIASGGVGNGAPATDEAPAATSESASVESIDVSGINASVITMPKMSDTMEEGVISSWLKNVGDSVESGDILAEVDTDKATMELESYEDGTLLYTAVAAGESVKVDGVIAIIGEKGADYEKLLKAQSQPQVAKPAEASKPVSTETATPEAPSTSQPIATSSSTNGRVLASPLAKKMAADKGIDIALVPGSGDGGRIIKRDIENFKAPAATPAGSETPASAPAITLPAIVGEESFDETPLSQMRKTISKRLSASKFTAPHFYVTMEINMDKAIEARKSMNEVSPVKISFNDMVVKAVAAALRQHPQVNSSWLEDRIRHNHHVHVGVAVAVDEGLLVPVIKFADNKPLSHIATEVKELAGKAKNKKLQPDEMTGNTFTISNLGMFGVEEFTAIINPPDACILAVGGIKQTAVVKDGQLVPGNIMKVTLSSDHRVVDGAMAAAFLQTLKGLLEDPVRILI